MRFEVGFYSDSEMAHDKTISPKVLFLPPHSTAELCPVLPPGGNALMADGGRSRLQSLAALRNYCRLLQIKEALNFLPCPSLICVPVYPELAVMDVHPHLVREHRHPRNKTFAILQTHIRDHSKPILFQNDY